jgi:thiamine-monophosphate kinase
MTTRSEEELIQWIQNRDWPISRRVRLGIGDDCCVYRATRDRELLVTTDLLVEGSHFSLDTTSPEDLGWKIGAANLSDIAAMGGRPTAFFFSASFPRDEQGFFERVVVGLNRILDCCETPLAGGDLSSGSSVLFSATVMGDVPKGKALLRSGARPEDGVFVTGTPGFSGIGLELLRSGFRLDNEDGLIPPGSNKATVRMPDRKIEFLIKHLRPVPRLEAGRILRKSQVVTSAIDTSDGIAKDLRQICRNSGVGAVLEKESLSRLATRLTVRLEDILCGGEDYELLFTLPNQAEETVLNALSAQGEFPPATRIGRICAEHPGELRLLDGENRLPLSVDGFDHFN